MKRIAAFAVAAFTLFAPVVPEAYAQDINVNGSLGNLYQSLYLQTHLGAGGTRRGSSTRRVRRVSAPAKWTLNPKKSGVIRRMVAAVPAADRPETRVVLEKTLASYPAIVRAVSKSTGVSLSASDPRDAAALAATAAFQELTGKELTNAQFAANRALSRRLFADGYVDATNMQESGETYALALGLMAVLKAYADNPKNPNPDLTRRQLRGLTQDTFRIGYRDPDYTKFAATDRGIVKVRK